MLRSSAIVLSLILSVGLGYTAFNLPDPGGYASLLIDLAFLASVACFLTLLVTTFGIGLKRLAASPEFESRRTSDRHQARQADLRRRAYRNRGQERVRRDGVSGSRSSAYY